MALGTGVGAELGVTADADGPAFVADEPLPPEVLPTVETVRALRHRHSEGTHNYNTKTKKREKGKNPAHHKVNMTKMMLILLQQLTFMSENVEK